MELFPSEEEEYLCRIARETARTSFPGRMQKIFKGDTKRIVEEYFVNKFSIKDLWKNSPRIVVEFDRWHRRNARKLGKILKGRIKNKKMYKGEAIATKLLNTFLHQLMKYEPYRPLWDKLHLPLDRGVFNKVWELRRSHEFPERIKTILKKYKKSPYSYNYKEYKDLQDALLKLIKQNGQQKYHTFTSRIELNAILWADK